MRLSLTLQALILIAIPLCFEIACVGMLIHTQKEAEVDAARAVKARKLSDCINRLHNELYVSYEEALNIKTVWVKTHRLDLSVKHSLDHVRERYNELNSLASDQPEIRDLVKVSLQKVDTADLMVKQAFDDIKAGRLDEVLRTQSAKMDQLRQMFRDCMSQELTLVAEHEKSVADASPGRQASLRDQIVTYAVLAVVFSIIFSAAIAAFVVKRITSRLNVINENARRLADGQPLKPAIKGSDEIAELDGVFHNMATDIEESVRMRQELVNMLTHDLRSPLTSIQGCLDMFSEGMLGELNERGERMISLAERNGKRMMCLINDLLDVQRVKAGMMSIEANDVSINEMFDEVGKNVSAWASEHDLKLEIKKTDLTVRGEREKLERIIFNLISNAIKFSPKGRTITLSAEKNGSFAQISVRDQGRGISKKAQASIFERFHQAEDGDSTKGGSGLGLAICQSFVNLHGGKIWIESEEGEGSCFTFSVPLAHQD